MNDADLVLRLETYGTDLLTRDRAMPIRQEIRRRLEALGTIRHLVVDLTGVRTMTPSFADELLGRLLLEIGEQKFRAQVRLVSGDDTTRLLVNRVLAQRAAEARRLTPT